MGITNRENALLMATGIDNSGLKKDLQDMEKEIDAFSRKMQSKEIKGILDNILGDFNQNIQGLARIQKELSEITTQRATINKAEKAGMMTTKESIQQRAQLLAREVELKNAKKELTAALNTEMRSMQAADGSIEKVALSLTQLTAAYDKLNAKERNGAAGAALASQISHAEAELLRLNAAMRATVVETDKLNQAAAASNSKRGGFNSLGYSVQQVARELPSLTMGASTFFLAISNNLPILGDELHKAKVEYEALKASGQKGVPVWKQVASSIIGWQTAMIMGVTILSMYGKEIVAWTKSLLKGKEAMKSTIDMQEEINKSIGKSASGFGDAVTKIRGLQDEWIALGDSMQKKKQFIEDNQSVFNELGVAVTGVKDAENILISNTDAFIQALKLRAQASAAQKLASESYEKQLQAERKAELEAIKGPSNWQKIKAGMISGMISGERANVLEDNSPTAEDFHRDRLKSLKEEADQAKATGDAYFDLQRKREQDIDSLLKQVGIETKSDAKQTINTKQFQDNKRELIRAEQDLQNSVEQARIDAMTDGQGKRLEQMKLNHAKELQELDREKENFLRRIINDEKAKFEAKAENQGKAFDPTGISLSEGHEEAFAIIYRRILEKQRSEQALFYKEALSNFQTYQERRVEILRKSAENERNILAAGGSEANVKENKLQTTEALSKLDAEFVQREETFKAWMENISSMTLSQLVDTLQQAEAQLSIARLKIATGGEDNLSSATLREQVKALKEQIKTLQNKQSKAEKKDSIKSWQETYKVLGKVNKELASIGDNIGGSVGELISFAGELSTQAMSMVSSISELSEMSVKSVETTATGAATAIKQVEKASVILAIVSSALSVVSKIKNALGGLKDAERDREEYTRTLIDLQNAYNNKLIETMLLHDDVFGTDDIGNTINAVKALILATENYNNLLDEQQEAWKDPSSNFFDKAFKHGTIMGWLGMSTEGKNKAATELKNNLRYITKKASNGFLGIGGNHTKTMDLSEWVKENLGDDLFYDNGRLNLDIAVNLVNNSSDRLTNQTKESLEALIAAEEQIRATEDAITDYISNTFGTLGDSMTNSLVEAFRNGTDAAEAFQDDVVSVLEDVGAQIARNLFLQDVIDDYSDALDKVYKKERSGSEADVMNAIASDVMNATNDFFTSFQGATNQANEWLKWYQEEAAKQGFDVFNPEDTSSGSLSASSRALTGVTQDSFSEGIGQVRALRMDVAELVMYVRSRGENLSSITSGMSNITTVISESRSILLQQLEIQTEIRNNTSRSLNLMNQIVDNGVSIKEGR